MKSNFNSVTIEGYVTQDPTYKDDGFSQYMCKIPIAVHNDYKKTDGTYVECVSYFTVKAFGDLVKECKNKCVKGVRVKVTGRLKQERWKTDAGEKRTFVCIIASVIEVLINPNNRKEFIKKQNEKAEEDARKERMYQGVSPEEFENCKEIALELLAKGFIPHFAEFMSDEDVKREKEEYKKEIADLKAFRGNEGLTKEEIETKYNYIRALIEEYYLERHAKDEDEPPTKEELDAIW